MALRHLLCTLHRSKKAPGSDLRFLLLKCVVRRELLELTLAFFKELVWQNWDPARASIWCRMRPFMYSRCLLWRWKYTGLPHWVGEVMLVPDDNELTPFDMSAITLWILSHCWRRDLQIVRQKMMGIHIITRKRCHQPTISWLHCSLQFFSIARMTQMFGVKPRSNYLYTRGRSR